MGDEIKLKRRGAVQSVLFSLSECCDAFNVLNEVHKLHTAVISKPCIPNPLPVARELIPALVGVARDCFCVRIAVLFDQRTDVHSLKRYFEADEITRLEKHPITIACKKARNKNICHMDTKYAKWPDVEFIVSSDVGELLEKIKLGIIFSDYR